MAGNFIKQLDQCGLKLHEENSYGNYYSEIKVKKLGERGELVVHEMVGLKCRWMECDVVDHDGLDMPDVDFIIATGVEGNPAIKAEDLPLILLPKISYKHQVETDLGPEMFPLIYAYDVEVVKHTAATPPSPSPQNRNSASADANLPVHGLISQLQQMKVKQTKFSEEFRLTGCNMRGEFQRNLIQCRRHMENKVILPLRVHPDTDNEFDKNAMAFQVKMPEDDLWKSVGYVGVQKIPKVREAYFQEEITELTMTIPTYSHSARTPGYFAFVCITKQNKWLPDDPNNQYLKP